VTRQLAIRVAAIMGLEGVLRALEVHADAVVDDRNLDPAVVRVRAHTQQQPSLS
jgi:hypothetical protein